MDLPKNCDIFVEMYKKVLLASLKRARTTPYPSIYAPANWRDGSTPAAINNADFPVSQLDGQGYRSASRYGRLRWQTVERSNVTLQVIFTVDGDHFL